MAAPRYLVPLAEANGESTVNDPADQTVENQPSPSVAETKPRVPAFLMRTLRRGAALALMVAAFWWLAFPALFTTSTHAVINARTAQIRSPLDGVAVRLHHDVGDRIEAGASVLELDGPKMGNGSALQTRRSEILAKVKRLTAVLKELKPAAADSQVRQDRYRKALVATLEASAEESETNVNMFQVAQDFATKRQSIAESLGRGESISRTELDSAREQSKLANLRIGSEASRLKKIKANLEAARIGAYVVETPYFHQRAEELALRVPELEAELAELNDLLAAIDAELDYQQQMSHVRSPVDGVVWTRHGNRGQIVKQNETIYEIAADGTIFVEALLPQRHLTTVGPRCRAVINLTGGRTLLGRVRAVRTIGPVDCEPSFAVKVADNDLKQVRILIDFDEMPADAPLLIGRHVSVLITREELAWYDHAAIFLFSNMRF